jgi:hypothetical protein
VVLSYGLKLEGMLLCMMCREDFIEDYNCAVSVSRRQDETLAIRRPTGRLVSIAKMRAFKVECTMSYP